MRLRTLIPAVIGAGVALACGPSANADELPPPPSVEQVLSQAQAAADGVRAQIDAALSAAGVALPTPPAAPPAAPAAEQPAAPAPAEPTQPEPAAAEVSPEQVATTTDGQPAIFVESPIFVDEQGRPMLDVWRKPNGPNYTWTTAIKDQILAGRPGEVLHRVEGSFFDAPATPRESIEAQIHGKSLYGPGTPIYVGKQNFCTLAVAGYDAAGNKVGLTAGHCGNVGDEVYSADSWENGVTGTVAAKDPGGDVAVIKLDEDATAVTRSYNGVTVNGVGATPAQPLANLCKMGVATGLTCGPSLVTTDQVNISQVCAMQGDSGGPLVVGDRLVGMVSGGLSALAPCRTPLQGPLFVPAISTNAEHVFAQLDARGGVGAGFRLPEPGEPVFHRGVTGKV
ncbi:S1 family peptidase [Corynebacterium aquilae]|uniref:S1 family peptidase n=1 Tax=Corynebacterium aquilae TaxID=203263 RepID=UPI000950C430|nr:S1 family peptidase [Corynebacterium aquilae]